MKNFIRRDIMYQSPDGKFNISHYLWKKLPKAERDKYTMVIPDYDAMEDRLRKAIANSNLDSFEAHA